jgi:hypothetical protein
MPKANYKSIARKQKKSITFYSILCGLFVALIGSYVYFKWIDYGLYKDAISLNENTIETLKTQVVAQKSDYINKKDDFDELSEDIEDSLKEVFPPLNSYTELTRAFDKFEEETDRNNNPFVISNIEYQEIQDAEDSDYKYLPLRMTISSSAENFTKFLQYAEKSGSLLDKVRLMDIQSIHLSFSESGDGGFQDTINFSVKIHAYFQNI